MSFKVKNKYEIISKNIEFKRKKKKEANPMETFAEYLLSEEDLEGKMDILYRLQRMLKERKNISIYFNNTVIFKTEIARMFLEYTNVGNEVDKNLVLTACLLYSCKKLDQEQSLENLYNYQQTGAEFLSTLGFDKRFCKICKEVNRTNIIDEREPESEILELVDIFGNLLLDKPERKGLLPEEAIVEMKTSIFDDGENQYLEQFEDFVRLMQEVEV